jgi:hypothetical protein
MLRLAGHRARMTSNAGRLVDNESVLQVRLLDLIYPSREYPNGNVALDRSDVWRAASGAFFLGDNPY